MSCKPIDKETSAVITEVLWPGTPKESPSDVFYSGFKHLPTRLKRRLSVHDLRQIWQHMAMPALESMLDAKQSENKKNTGGAVTEP